MALDPLVTVFLEQLAAQPRHKPWEVPPEVSRAGFRATIKAFGPKDVPIGKVENVTMPGPGGDLPLRVYTPVAAGGEALPATSAQFAAMVNAERARYEKLIREAGIKPD